MSLKGILKSWALKYGYQVSAVTSHQVTPAIALFNRRYLQQICQPKTVIDVGVGFGTYELYEAFPKAKFILVEPLTEYQNAIDDIAAQFDCEVHFVSVGEKAGKHEIVVDVANPTKSSFKERTALTTSGNCLEPRLVEMTTLDALCASNRALQKPILLKLDTEGFEMEALRGAQELLRSTDIVIAEISIARRFENSYCFEDAIGFMHENGFYVYSFLDVQQVSGELRPRFADIVFKRRTQREA